MNFHAPAMIWLTLGIGGLAILAHIFWMRRWTQQAQPMNPHVFGKVIRRFWMLHLPLLLAVLGVVALGMALAQPYQIQGEYRGLKQGIDVMILLDVSSSMLAEDFKPNRLEAAKQTIQVFSQRLVNDRVGLIVYSGEAYVQYPLSFDHPLMAQFLSFVKSGYLKPGTAIGDALAHGVQRLKHAESKKRSRLIILLTDGDHNAGTITPLQAAGLATAEAIPVYTIAIGKEGQVPFPVYLTVPTGLQRKTYQMVQSRVNYALLQQLATMTGGKFYRVDEADVLASVLADIQQIEKSKLPDIKPRTHEVYWDQFFMWVALVLLLGSFVIEKFWIRVEV